MQISADAILSLRKLTLICVLMIANITFDIPSYIQLNRYKHSHKDKCKVLLPAVQTRSYLLWPTSQ